MAGTLDHRRGWTAAVVWLLAQYAAPGRHHTAHITALRERMGWR